MRSEVCIFLCCVIFCMTSGQICGVDFSQTSTRKRHFKGNFSEELFGQQKCRQGKNVYVNILLVCVFCAVFFFFCKPSGKFVWCAFSSDNLPSLASFSPITTFSEFPGSFSSATSVCFKLVFFEKKATYTDSGSFSSAMWPGDPCDFCDVCDVCDPWILVIPEFHVPSANSCPVDLLKKSTTMCWYDSVAAWSNTCLFFKRNTRWTINFGISSRLFKRHVNLQIVPFPAGTTISESPGAFWSVTSTQMSMCVFEQNHFTFTLFTFLNCFFSKF